MRAGLGGGRFGGGRLGGDGLGGDRFGGGGLGDRGTLTCRSGLARGLGELVATGLDVGELTSSRRRTLRVGVC